MAQGGGAGKVVLYVVLGVIAVVLGIQILDTLLTAVFWGLAIGAVVAVTMLVVRASRRSVGGRNRRRLPR